MYTWQGIMPLYSLRRHDHLGPGGEVLHVRQFKTAPVAHTRQLGVLGGQSHCGRVDVVAEALKGCIPTDFRQGLFPLPGPDLGRA